MADDALAVIREFWRIQDAGDYTKVVPLFAEDGGFMAKMSSEMRARKTHFRAVEIAGAGDVAWAQWLAETPAGEIHGVGVYRTRAGQMTYYRDYMNAPAPKQG